MPDNSTPDVTDAAVTALRDLTTALEADEKRLTAELASVKDRRKAVAKSLTALTGDAAPRRRRGRPRKDEATAETRIVAAPPRKRS